MNKETIREPAWTVYSNVTSEGTTWVGSSWEFFDDEGAADARYTELSEQGHCPTKRPYYRRADSQYLHGEIVGKQPTEMRARRRGVTPGSRALHGTGFSRFIAKMDDDEVGVSVLHDEWTTDDVLLQLEVDGCPLGRGKPTVVGWPADNFKVVRVDELEIQFTKEVDRRASTALASSSARKMMIGGHDELCDVFQPAPDGGPSQKPCNCRPSLGKTPECTSVSATWCPIHGDCNCDREAGEMNSEACPLHSRASTHAQGASTK